MAGRKIRDARDARACLDDLTRKGVSCGEWGRSHGVDARSLQAWRLILSRRDAQPEPVRFVELEAAPSRKPLVVRCGPLSVEVEEGFDDSELGRVLRAMASAC